MEMGGKEEVGREEGERKGEICGSEALCMKACLFHDVACENKSVCEGEDEINLGREEGRLYISSLINVKRKINDNYQK